MKEANTFVADKNEVIVREAWKFRARNMDGRRGGANRIDALNAKSISTVESWNERATGKWKALSYFRRGIWDFRINRDPLRHPFPFISPRFSPAFPPRVIPSRYPRGWYTGTLPSRAPTASEMPFSRPSEHLTEILLSTPFGRDKVDFPEAIFLRNNNYPSNSFIGKYYSMHRTCDFSAPANSIICEDNFISDRKNTELTIISHPAIN